MNSRDDFTEAVKLLLAKRVGTLCANPRCSAPTYGPNQDPMKTISEGVAAHITAASPGGPRHDPQISSTQRKSPENGVWLCQNCAKLVDNDPKRYSVSILQQWKEQAEERALRAIENPAIVNSGPDFASTLILATRQLHNTSFDATQVGPNSRRYIPIQLCPISAPRDLIDINVPLTFTDEVPPGACLITINCQNLGTGLDQNIKIDLSFRGKSAIRSVNILNPQRLHLIEGGTPKSSFASFTIPSLLPREKQDIRIIANYHCAFDITLWSQRSGKSPDVFIYDVVFHPPEVA